MFTGVYSYRSLYKTKSVYYEDNSKICLLCKHDIYGNRQTTLDTEGKILISKI